VSIIYQTCLYPNNQGELFPLPFAHVLPLVSIISLPVPYLLKSSSFKPANRRVLLKVFWHIFVHSETGRTHLFYGFLYNSFKHRKWNTTIPVTVWTSTTWTELTARIATSQKLNFPTASTSFGRRYVNACSHAPGGSRDPIRAASLCCSLNHRYCDHTLWTLISATALIVTSNDNNVIVITISSLRQYLEDKLVNLYQENEWLYQQPLLSSLYAKN